MSKVIKECWCYISKEYAKELLVLKFGAVAVVIKPLDDVVIVAVKPSNAVLCALEDLVDASRDSTQFLFVFLFEQFDLWKKCSLSVRGRCKVP